MVNEEPNQEFTEDQKMELTNVLDRLSSTLFANNGWVSSIFRNFVSPGLKQINRFDRRHKWASGLLKAVAFIGFLLCCLQFIEDKKEEILLLAEAMMGGQGKILSP